MEDNTIRLTTDESGAHRVGSHTAKQGEEVTWDPGDLTVTIWFPRPGVFSEASLEIAKGQTGSMTVLSDAPVGEHEYSIYCHDTRKFFEGNSHPVMLIDPGPGP